MADVLVLTKNLSTGANEAMTKLKVDNTNGQLKSTTPDGTPPLTLLSTTKVTNLNADLLDGNDSSAFATATHMQSATYGGTGISTAASTGVPVIASGTWSVDASALSAIHGGTGHTTTSVGDLLVGAATNIWNKLTIGTNGQVLTSNGTTAGWATPAAAPNSFTTMAVPAGTNPVADSGTDTLNWTSSGSTLVITGNATTDTINLDLAAAYQLPAGAAGNTLYYSSGWVANTNVLMTASKLNLLDAATLTIGTGDDLTIGSDGTNVTMTALANLTIASGTANGTFLKTGTNTVATSVAIVNAGSSALFEVLGSGKTTSYVPANVASALRVLSGGTNSMLDITTTTGTEIITFGNATNNPDYSFIGSGTFGQGAGGGQVTFTGNVNCTNGLDVTGADLTVGGAAFAVGIDGIVDAGTWQATSVKLGYGGTGITSATNGDILFYNGGVSTTAYQKLGIGSTGALLTVVSGMPAWSTAPTTAGDILYWTAGGWTRLASGGANTCLTSDGAGVLSWTDPGGGYNWAVTGDSGGPKTIADGNTLNFVGGLGVITTISGASSPYSCSIAADADGVTLINNGGTGSVQLAVKTNGIAESHIDWAATGATKIHSTNIPYDTAWNTHPNIGTIGTAFPTQDALQSITDVFAAIDTAIGNVAAGLTFKGPTFSKYQFVTGSGITGTAIKQGQTIDFTLGKASATDVFKVYDGTTTRTYTAVSGAPGALQFDVSGTISQMVQSLAAAIEADGSKIVRAQASNFPELDATNNVLVLSAISTLTTFRTWASIGIGGTPWTYQPYYITQFNGTSDDDTVLPSADPTTSNFSAVIDQSALIEGDTYVSRSCGCWERWDNTDNEWVTIMVSPSQAYVGGNGITIDTTTEPDSIKVNLATDPGLEFDTSALRVKLNGTTLLRGSSGLSVNPATDVGWTTVPQTFNAGVKSDTVAEVTAAAGVTVDGCKIKDGVADSSCWLMSPAGLAGTGGVAVGDIVYLSTSATAIKAKADSTSTGFVYGISRTTASSGNPCDILMAGGYQWTANDEVRVNVQTTSGYAVGDRLYVSKVTAGTAHNTVSAYIAGDWIQCIGKITDVTNQASGYVSAIINVEEPYVLV